MSALGAKQPREVRKKFVTRDAYGMTVSFSLTETEIHLLRGIANGHFKNNLGAVVGKKNHAAQMQARRCLQRLQLAGVHDIKSFEAAGCRVAYLLGFATL